MISEVERIQSGLVEATVEFNTQRKVIGVATTNLLPNENGIVPLSKQGAFQVVEQTVETIDFNEATNVVAENNVEAIEQLDLPAMEEPVAPTIQEPLHEDVITNVPVNVESPQDLSTFKIPEPVAEEEPAIMEPIGPVAVDIQMPEMPETIVANEPSIMDENIFESVSTQQMTEPTQVMPETPQMDVQPQTEQFEIPSLTQSEEILNSIPTAEETSEEAPMFEPVDTAVPAQEEISIEMPTMEENPELQVTEQPLPEELNPVSEPIKEEINEMTNIPEILDIDKIIETNRNALLAYADELIKSAEQIKAFVNKSFDEINSSIKTMPKEPVQQQETQPQQMVTNQVNNMVTAGNNLVEDAISRINAISEPGLKL